MRVFLIIALLFLLATPAVATWNVHTVTTAAVTGEGTALVVIGTRAGICYRDYTNEKLCWKYASIDAPTASGSWETVVDVDTSVKPYFLSICSVGSKPACAYLIGTELWYARATDTAPFASWVHMKVANIGNAMRDCSLIEDAGKPVIAYYYATTHSLIMIRSNSATPTSTSNWNTSYPIRTGSSTYYQGYGVAAVSHPLLGPILGYHCVTGVGGKEFYWACWNYTHPAAAAYTAFDWDAGRVTGYSDFPYQISGALLEYNIPIFFFAVDGKIAYAYPLPLGVSQRAIVGTPNPTGSGDGRWLSATTISNHPYCVFYDGTDDNLCVYYTTSHLPDPVTASWTTETIDSTGSVGQYCSAAVLNGKLAVSYYDETNEKLKFAREN